MATDAMIGTAATSEPASLALIERAQAGDARAFESSSSHGCGASAGSPCR